MLDRPPVRKTLRPSSSGRRFGSNLRLPAAGLLLVGPALVRTALGGSVLSGGFGVLVGTADFAAVRDFEDPEQLGPAAVVDLDELVGDVGPVGRVAVVGVLRIEHELALLGLLGLLGLGLVAYGP